MKELGQNSILNLWNTTFKSIFFQSRTALIQPTLNCTFNFKHLPKCLTKPASLSAEGCRKELRDYLALFLSEGFMHGGGGGELWEESELISTSQPEHNEECDLKLHCSFPLLRKERAASCSCAHLTGQPRALLQPQQGPAPLLLHQVQP